MLIIYRAGIDKIPDKIRTIHDIEDEFKGIQLLDTELNRDIMKYIDFAEYVDSVFYKSKFGNQLEISCLSTGCKTAVLVNERPNSIIDTIECGKNVIEVIISFCKRGGIIVHDCEKIYDLGNITENIDVMIGNTHFNSLYELNQAIDWSGWNEL